MAPSTTTFVILGIAVVLFVSNRVPVAVVALAVSLGLWAISWTTVVLVAGMIPLSGAMQKTGAAETLADALVSVVGDAGPRVLLIGLFLLVATLSQLISSTATALIVIPIALTTAADLGVSPMPVLLCVLVASTASLLTPVATPANLMIMDPAGYRFGDYTRIGMVLMVWYAVIAVLWVPVVWSF